AVKIVATPAGVSLPIRPVPRAVTESVNHKFPSAPTVRFAATPPTGTPLGYSVITPAVVIRPILPPPSSVNHMLPSGPVTIWSGFAEEEIPAENSLIVTAVDAAAVGVAMTTAVPTAPT